MLGAAVIKHVCVLIRCYLHDTVRQFKEMLYMWRFERMGKQREVVMAGEQGKLFVV